MPFGRLAVIGTIGSVATCYSRIVFHELVWQGDSAPPDINPHLQAAIMTGFAVIALVGLFLDRRQHQSSIPFAVGLLGVLIIVGTLYVHYRPDIEFTGYITLIVAVFLNQTVQLKRLNRAVEALNTELTDHAREAQQATGAKSRFLANMSHELRTPLKIYQADAVVRATRSKLERKKRELGEVRSSLTSKTSELIVPSTGMERRIELLVEIQYLTPRKQGLENEIRTLSVDLDRHRDELAALEHASVY